MRLLKALGALLLLAALLFGVPWALLQWGQLSGLAAVDWSTALTRPDDGRITLGILSAAGWLAWAVLAATTVFELVRALTRGVVDVRLPGTGWLRPAVATLVAAIAAPLLGSALAGSHPDLAPPSAAAVAPLEDGGGELIEPPGTPREDPSMVAPELQQYMVQHGDELWSVAERELGSGERWREVVAANPGMSHDTHLSPGTVINLPAPASSAGAEAEQYVSVVEGDTLWDLADEHLGEAERWPELHTANSDLVQDPDQIQPGWELFVPATGAQTPADPAREPEEPDSTADTQPADESGPAPEVEPHEQATTPPGVPGDDVADHAEDSAATPAASIEPAPVETPPEDTPGLEAAAEQNLLGPLGAVLAAGIFAGVAARRRTQLLQRAVGRRVLPLRPDLLRFWAGLGRRSSEAPQTDLSPTGVVLGWREDKEVTTDLEGNRCTLVQGSGEDCLAVVSAMLTSLVCATWSTTVEVVTVDSPDDWESSLDDPRATAAPNQEQALVDLQKLCASRRIELGSSRLAELRADDDLASAWQPVVFLFCSPVDDAVLRRIEACLELGEVGVSVVAAVADAPPLARSWQLLHVESAEQATLLPDGTVLAPQLLSAPARHAVIELFVGANDTTTQPAPWWEQAPLPPNVKVLPRKTLEPTKDTAMPARTPTPDHPTLLLLGPVELRGCAGPAPSRGKAASTECCAWLLANPGSTPTRMARDLVVAETTRRSVVSRLRTWLGSDATGSPYLPDGYSGRLELHPDVESDWERFQMLLAGGVNLASSPVLQEALELVRGEPLEDVTFLWPWAEQLRTDMVSMVTDAAVVLFERAMELGDVDTARWAVARGRLAAGEDETLAVREIQLLALAGDRAQVDQAVRRLTRAARTAGRDLATESVHRIQQALHTVVAGQHAN